MTARRHREVSLFDQSRPSKSVNGGDGLQLTQPCPCVRDIALEVGLRVLDQVLLQVLEDLRHAADGVPNRLLG